MCSGTFATKKELRVHIGGTSHLRLRVVCPWCTDGERTSNRIGDLKRHAVTKHGADSIVTEKFFTDGNGFYLSIFPEDYSKVITPAMPTSEEARTAMNLMRLWAGAVANPSRTLQDWENGWKRGNATPTREEPSPYNPGSPISSAQIPYSPTRPEMTSHIRINQMLLLEDKVELDVVLDDAFYIVNLNSSIKRDVVRLTKIQDSVVNTRARPHGVTSEVKGTKFDELSQSVSETIQVSEVFIDNIQVIKPILGRLPRPFPKKATLPLQSAALPPPLRASAPISPSQQARDLLSWGVMPLIPPARRNWDQDEVVSLRGRNTSLKWPPKGWRTFTAVRKLQVFEHASGLLDSDVTGFPVTSKSDILDKYNFLVLPGSSPSPRSAKTGMRHGNYMALREIALELENDGRMLKMFQSASHDRDSEVDHMIKAINNIGVRLRLEK